jgi:rhodanese-related sulfurtransferase/transcriptional regulator with XRE-family HTH domain
MAAGELDVVDVRSPAEWASGHLPGARNVPLEQLKADPRGKIPHDRVLFVCARGPRSLTASQVAEGAGFREVYQLDGGTEAWASLGLPIETSPRAAAPARAPLPTDSEQPASAQDPSCGLPPPGLETVVGANLRELRSKRNLSLDTVAQMTGLSRNILGQIELGKTSPSVSMVWKIARAFDVQFSALLAIADHQTTHVLRGDQAKRLISSDGRFSSRALYPLDEPPPAEFYELFLAAHSREDAQPHRAGTRENLIVTKGRVDLEFGGQRFELAQGDAILFSADVPHSYENPGNEDSWMYLVMTYAGPVGS